MSSVAPAGITPANLISIEGMDLESMMLSVQTNRANLLEDQLKSQVAHVQKKNSDISKMNEALSQLNAAVNLFPPGAKADAEVRKGTTFNDGDCAIEKQINKSLKDAGLEVFDKNPGRLPDGSTMPGSISGLSTKGDIETAVQRIKTAIDAATNTQQMDMIRLQSLGNKRNEAFETMTNFIKKMQDSRNSIIGNMR